MKIALITGITGQDGSYLSDLLLEKDYIVWGIIRRASDINTHRIEHLRSNSNLILKYGDLTDSSNLLNIIYDIKHSYPNMERLEIYNLGAMSHVKVSFDMPEYCADADGVGTLRLLEGIRSAGIMDKCRFYQASTSELYGLVQETPQRETTPFYPRSPYAVAKLYAYWITVNYREAYGLFASNGILFNHESPIRGETFVTRKITRAVSRIALGIQDEFYLGNLDSKRDWGHAKDYIRMMWLILQADKAEDWVIATGRTTTIRDFVKMAFGHIGVELEFTGKGLNEVAKVKSCSNSDYQLQVGKKVLSIDKKYFRPTEVDLLVGDATKAKDKLGWEPHITLEELVEDMMISDIKLFKKDKYLKNEGFNTHNYFE